MEFVFVEYTEDRRVDMDGAMFGITNRVLACPAGFHTFDLNEPVDYSPVSQYGNVTGTTDTTPLHVPFRPSSGALIAIDRTPPPAPPSAAKRKKKSSHK